MGLRLDKQVSPSCHDGVEAIHPEGCEREPGEHIRIEEPIVYPQAGILQQPLGRSQVLEEQRKPVWGLEV